MSRSIVGPVVPIPMPFLSSGEIDHDSAKNYVHWLTDSGIRNVMTTIGTSRYNLVSREEAFAFNQTIARAAKDKGIVSIVANPPGCSTSAAIEFGKAADAEGADYYLLFYPERYYGEEPIFEFFNSVASEVKSKILIHEMPMRNGFGGGTVQYSVNLLERLLKIPSLVGMKEEALDPGHSKAILKAFGQSAEIIGAGGGMSRYLRDYQYGAQAFLSGIANFEPSVELNFYEKMTSRQHAEANDIVYTIEAPFFESMVPVGWHIALKSVLGLENRLPANERAPMPEVSAENQKSLKEAVDRLRSQL